MARRYRDSPHGIAGGVCMADESKLESLSQNEAFWAQVAEELEWFRKWDKVFESVS
jgi:hypothetical protein